MSRRNDSDPNKTLLKYIGMFNNELINQKNKYSNDELEIRFGTNHRNPITRNQFENTICKLKSSGWYSPKTEENFLKIQTEYFNQDNILVATRQASMVHREVESE